MDSAINGVLQSLDPYSAYMSPELLRACKRNLNEFRIRNRNWYGSDSKVISPISDTPAEKAGIKAGDYIVRINNEQEGKTLMEAVKLMRGPSWF